MIISLPRNPKIKDLDELAGCLRKLKAEGKKVVLAHGVFDLLHVGHIFYFEQAKQWGDILVVTLTQDQHVNKGPLRPAFPQDLRAEMVAALGVVDYVAINRWPLAVETIRLLQPDIYAKGPDYRVASQDVTGGIVAETEAVQEIGGEIRFTEDVTFSSSQLINKYFSPFSEATEQYLQKFRTRYSLDEVLNWIEQISHLKVLVVGEAIIDEYVFCDGLGKSTKDPVLAFQYRSMETYAGGSLAVANHAAGLCDKVGLITFLGEVDRREDFVRRALLPNVKPFLLTRKAVPTIHKRRFVDTHTSARVFELYVMNDDLLNPAQENTLETVLEKNIRDYDVVVVSDYGHGMLTPKTIQTLCQKARFLAVNTQANAGNRGFNTIAKYPRADYVCLAGHEVQLETRMRHAEWSELVDEVIKKINCTCFTITQGHSGSLHYEPRFGFTQVPAFADYVKDRVGAGDAFLAVTSLLVAEGAPWDIVGLIGNLAGAEMVSELGNRVVIDKVSLVKHVTSVLK